MPKKMKIPRPHFPKRTLDQMLIEFKMHWRNYVYQSLFATFAVLIILAILKFENAVVVASIAASVFIVFTMPNAISARRRAIIGGHCIGMIIGSIIAFMAPSIFIFSIILYSLAVGITMFLMVVFDMEHPPACGTALGVALTGFSWGVALAIITSTVVLALIKTGFKPYLKDLV